MHVFLISKMFSFIFFFQQLIGFCFFLFFFELVSWILWKYIITSHNMGFAIQLRFYSWNVMSSHNLATLRIFTNVSHIKMWEHLNCCLWIELKDRKYRTNIWMHFAWNLSCWLVDCFELHLNKSVERNRINNLICLYLHMYIAQQFVVAAAFVVYREFSLSAFIIKLVDAMCDENVYKCIVS